MAMQVRSLAQHSGLRIQCRCSYGSDLISGPGASISCAYGEINFKKFFFFFFKERKIQNRGGLVSP